MKRSGRDNLRPVEYDAGVPELNDASEELDETTADPGVAARIPQFYELFRPLLEVLVDGGDWKLPDAAEAVADALGLGEEERTVRFRSGRLLFENRVRWAFTSLSKAELVELVGPSTVRITCDGSAVLGTEEKIDRGFLLRTRSSYAAWHVDMGIEEPKPAEAEAGVGVWMVRAGRGGIYAPQFVLRSAAIVGWGETGDVTGMSREAIADRVESHSRPTVPASAVKPRTRCITSCTACRAGISSSPLNPRRGPCCLGGSPRPTDISMTHLRQLTITPARSAGSPAYHETRSPTGRATVWAACSR